MMITTLITLHLQFSYRLNRPLDPHNPLLNKYPLDLALIQQFQQKDPALLKATEEGTCFSFQRIYDREQIVYQHFRSSQKAKIVVPQALQYPTIKWMHSLLGQAGITRLASTLSTHFWFPNMTQFCD